MATLIDIAKRSGVSITTVSKVINNKGNLLGISENTQKRILNSIKELNYTPNLSARALRTKKNYTIGIISYDAEDPYANTVAKEIEGIMSLSNYYSFVVNANHNSIKAEEYLNEFVNRKVEGIIILCSSLNFKDDFIENIKATNIPIITIGQDWSNFNIPSIFLDNVKGGFLATEYLIKSGHKKIGFIVGPDGYVESNQRFQGYMMALEQYELKKEDCIMIKEDRIGWTPICGYKTMKQIIDNNNGYTAIVCFDDITAFGAIRSSSENGFKVPEDISVIGFDDLIISAYYNPPLTTIRQPMKEIGQKTANLLLEIINNKELPKEQIKIIMQPELVIRNSCRELK
jgi:LacI family transcriptional regulator